MITARHEGGSFGFLYKASAVQEIQEQDMMGDCRLTNKLVTESLFNCLTTYQTLVSDTGTKP